MVEENHVDGVDVVGGSEEGDGLAAAPDEDGHLGENGGWVGGWVNGWVYGWVGGWVKVLRSYLVLEACPLYQLGGEGGVQGVELDGEKVGGGWGVPGDFDGRVAEVGPGWVGGWVGGWGMGHTLKWVGGLGLYSPTVPLAHSTESKGIFFPFLPFLAAAVGMTGLCSFLSTVDVCGWVGCLVWVGVVGSRWGLPASLSRRRLQGAAAAAVILEGGQEH